MKKRIVIFCNQQKTAPKRGFLLKKQIIFCHL